ncbi:hypothetical protein [Bacillus massiliglaciei]|uniref:hypothetical protein n=1 Tax=Bacillus massiliglaciei TaxID=1816693 RepID=UPI000DA62245|nr:hypothetical protein [Bacillus massiliglaciei]
MDGKKDDSFTGGTQIAADCQKKEKERKFSKDTLLELMERLPPFARKPLCRFELENRRVIGRLESRKGPYVFIRHQFGKKAVPYEWSKIQDIQIIKN